MVASNDLLLTCIETPLQFVNAHPRALRLPSHLLIEKLMLASSTYRFMTNKTTTSCVNPLTCLFFDSSTKRRATRLRH
jgi:hypothetical protein